jgi:hypothetical protein
LAIYEDTQKSSWVLVDATVFAALAGLTEAVWMRLVGGFLYHSLGGAARIESVKLASSANTSLLKVALTSTASPGWRGAVSMNVLLSEFRNGNVTGLLLPLPVVQALMSEEGSPRNLTMRKSQLTHAQALGLDRLLTTAKNYLEQLPTERWERAIRLAREAQKREATRRWPLAVFTEVLRDSRHTHSGTKSISSPP